ncbi:MAG: fibronectin type III domain-containing protein [Flavobacteriales bacterium]|nr:fibronectin type III domain-containing protein [Flavobacteriales bacterium]
MNRTLQQQLLPQKLNLLLLFAALFFSGKTIAQGTTCATAIPITINGTCITTAVVNDGTQNAPNLNASCGAVSFRHERWYTFTVTGGPLNVTITADSVDRDLYLQLMSSTAACAGLSQIACADDDTAANSSQTEIIDITLANGIYYLKVCNVGGGSSMTIDELCITAALNPCSSTTALASCGTAQTATITSGIGMYDTQVCGISTLGNEKIYTYTPTVTGNYSIQQNSSFSTISYQFKPVSNGCNGNNWICVGNLNGSTTSNSFILTAGVAYYIMLDTEITTGESVNFSLNCSTPVLFNDECSNATNLSVNSSTNCVVTATGTTVGATESYPGCSGTADDDVWYSFTALSTNHIVTVTPNTLSDAVFEVFDGTCDGGLFSILCQDNTVGSGIETSFISGLIVGNTYLVRVHSSASFSGQGSFTICVSSPPNPCLNPIEIDACDTTINLVVPSGYGSYTNYACGDETNGIEQIYVFTPQDNGDYYIQQNSAFGSVNYQIKLKADGCNDLGWNCISSLTGNSVSSYMDLTQGEEYYILVDPQDTTGGTINFTLSCKVNAPANDECVTAINIPVNPTTVCTTSVTGTTIGADESMFACSGTADDDVWYTFTATSDTHAISVTPTTLVDAVFEVFDGTCLTLNSLGCFDNTYEQSIESGTITGLIIGNVYFVRVYSSGSDIGFGGFTICITTPPNPCDFVSPIICGTTTNTTLPSGLGNYTYSACGTIADGVEQIYSFTPTTTASYTIEQLSSFGLINYQIKEASLGCDSTNWNCIYSLSNAQTSPYFELTAGTEYYIVLDPATSTGGAISFSVTCGVIPPANDEACNAIPLTVNSSCIYDTYSNTNASNSLELTTPNCGNYVDDDIWFSVEVPPTGIVNIDTQIGNVTNSGIAVYSGTCSILTQIACDDDSSANGLMSALTISNRTPGEILYIRVWENGGGNSGDFGICITTPPFCSVPTSQATNFVLSSSTSNTVSASFTGSASGYLILQSQSNIPPLHPVNGITYNSTNVNTLGVNYFFVQNSPTPNFTNTSLSGNTHYYYYIYAYTTGSACAGPVYSPLAPLTGDTITCITVPTSVVENNITASTFTLDWFAPSGGNALPITFTIQVSTDAGFTTNIPGSPFTVNNPITAFTVTGLSINTVYYYQIKASTAACSSAQVTGSVFTGYCLSNSTNATRYITNFSTTGGITNISNLASGYSPTGLGDFSALVVTQEYYGTVNFSANFFNGTFSYGFNIWVDWNNDLDFIDAGEKVYASGAYVTSASGSFIIPTTALVGAHKMRIRADISSLNPNPCGTITLGETEDYTLKVNALPCSQNPTNVTATFTSQTTATVSWTASNPIPTDGYQYYFSTSAVNPTYTTLPTGTIPSTINSINFATLIPNLTYYFWIRSNCDVATGQGIWIGPISFSQLNCAPGNGTGTSALGCPSVIAGGLSLNGVDPSPIGGCTTATNCVDLEANYLHLGQTTSYTVQSIPYAPPYQFGCLQNPVSINTDDVWSPIVNLPFNFCFYGNNYNQCLISSNGVISFDIVGNVPSGYSAWSFASNIPNPSLFKNSIFGVYQDIHPGVGGTIGWELITLNTGCRALVASWKNVPMYACTSQLYSGMMVLYENTNVIEIYIQQKTLCSTWNGGNAIVGLQNATGTQATIVPGRNGLDADWAVNNEAWRFVPSGASLTSIKWHEGSGTSGPIIGTTDTINVCPTTTTTYTAEVTYNLCNGTVLTETDETIVVVNGSKTWNGSVDTDWNKPNNWTPSILPDATDCVVIPVTPNDPIISGVGYNAFAGTLTVHNNASLTLTSDNNLSVTNLITVQPSGYFAIENNGSLIQIDNITNVGNINYQRTASIKRNDYVYWSAPVGNFNINNIASPVVPGPIFKWNPTIANTNNGQGNWETALGNTMLAGKGYIMRGPDSFSSVANAPFNANFIGVPNNGIITQTIARGNDENLTFHAGLNGTEITNFSDNLNLVGNPYPSSIRASQFLLNNNTKIEGNIYIWTHQTLPSAVASPFYGSFVYNYTASDYIVYNFTGTNCCPAASSDLFIGAGQGFFVEMKDGPTATDSIEFTNSLRSPTYDNDFFFRSANNTPNTLADIERHRYWLDIVDTNGQSNRTLIGYVQGATNNKDSFFDCRMGVSSQMSIFSEIEQQKLSIQGRSLPFSLFDEVPIGVNLPQPGTYNISLAAIDGLFTTQNIYLKDQNLNIIHDLKSTPYSFFSTPQTINDRFKIVYTNSILGTIDQSFDNEVKVITDEKITIESSSIPIKEIQVYNVLGSRVAEYRNINLNTFTINNLIATKSGLFLKIVLDNDGTVMKRMVY